jgi:hypothetical protein
MGSRTSVASIDQRNKPAELEKPLVYYGASYLYAGNIRNDFFVERADFIKFASCRSTTRSTSRTSLTSCRCRGRRST